MAEAARASSVLPTMATSEKVQGAAGSCARALSAERSEPQRRRVAARSELTLALVTTGLILAIAACTVDVVTDYLLQRARLEQPCGGAR